MKNHDIVKSNALVEAAHEPGSIYRMRVLLSCLLQIKAGEKLSHKKVFKITATGLADLTGTTNNNIYRDLKKAASDIFEMKITVQKNPDGTPLRADRKIIRVVSECAYFDKEGTIEVVFTPQIMPYISGLQKQFTKYKAQYVMPMRSVYGIRLYELCLQWMSDEREFEVDEFREIMGLGNKHDRIASLKRIVIDPALEDINKHTDIQVTFGQRKAGRIITHFQFQITRKTAATKKRIGTNKPTHESHRKYRAPVEISRIEADKVTAELATIAAAQKVTAAKKDSK